MKNIELTKELSCEVLNFDELIDIRAGKDGQAEPTPSNGQTGGLVCWCSKKEEETVN